MQVSMQEFKSHLSRYVSQAQSGQLIELTSHRRVVARIVGAVDRKCGRVMFVGCGRGHLARRQARGCRAAITQAWQAGF